MWGKRREVPVSTAMPVVVGTVAMSQEPAVPEATSAVFTLDAETAREYAAVCAELGFTPKQFLAERVLMFCQENNIQVYNLKDVQEYMNHKCGREGEYSTAGWGWWPMRPQDVDIMPGKINNSGRCWKDVYNREFGGGVSSIRSHYREVIPLPVLLTAQKIQKGVPEIAGFAVAAPCDKELKDPFLGVMVDAYSAPIIVERWDEPGFRQN